MDQKTHLSNVLESNNCKDQYDTQVKKVLSNKTVLAWILKYTVSEFKEYPIPLIKQCIEGEPEVGTHRVFPSATPDAIIGSDTVDKIPGEGQVTYDVRFYAITPTKKRIKLIINVEGQKKFRRNLVPRGIFYCARMISAQKDTEFKGDDYDDIKKVYSIWVCMNVPKYAEYTITSYKMEPSHIYGRLKKEFRYDLLEVVMICLGDDATKAKGNRLHRMLNTLFSKKLKPNEKQKILSDEFGIEPSEELEGGLRLMCNFSDLIEEEALQKGIEQGIEQGERHHLLTQIQKKLAKGKSLEQMAEELEETVDVIRPLYAEALEEMN